VQNYRYPFDRIFFNNKFVVLMKSARSRSS